MMVLKRIAFIATTPIWLIVYILAGVLTIPFQLTGGIIGWIIKGNFETGYNSIVPPVARRFFYVENDDYQTSEYEKIWFVRMHQWSTVPPPPKPSLEQKIRELEIWHERFEA